MLHEYFLFLVLAFLAGLGIGGYLASAAIARHHLLMRMKHGAPLPPIEGQNHAA